MATLKILLPGFTSIPEAPQDQRRRFTYSIHTFCYSVASRCADVFAPHTPHPPRQDPWAPRYTTRARRSEKASARLTRFPTLPARPGRAWIRLCAVGVVYPTEQARPQRRRHQNAKPKGKAKTGEPKGGKNVVFTNNPERKKRLMVVYR